MKHFLRFSQAVKLTNKLHDAPFADLKKRSEYENIEDELQRLSATHLFDVVVRRTDFIGRFVVDVTNIVGSELISQHQDGNYLRQTRVWYSQIDCTRVSFCTIHVLFVELFFIQFDLFDYLFIYIIIFL